MRRNILFEYLHDNEEVKDDEWGRYGRLGLGSRGNTALLIGCLPWVHRVYSTVYLCVCDAEVQNQRRNEG